MTGNSGEEGKLVHEHVASILPFSVAEKIADKQLRIRGLAMTAGLSRNFNLYTSEELAAFAGKLQAAPVYLEHVSVNDAVGKVTKTEWDGQNLLYEAEIYDDETAAKIRKGLIRHVSVGADYETLDVTAGGKVPHGLHNAEMSLVAVPGIPETNIQVLESLLRKATEQLEAEIPGEYFLGFVQDPNLFLAEHFRTVWLDQANGILAVMAKTRSDPAAERCQEILFLKSKWQPNTVADWLHIHPDYTAAAAASDLGVQNNGVEKLEEKDIDKIAEKVALKVGEKESVAMDKVKAELTESKAKQVEAEGKAKDAETVRDKALGDLSTANKTIEQLKQLVPGVDLLANPPKLMPVVETLTRLERCVPSLMVERASLGNQRHAQEVRREIYEVKQKYGVA